MNANIDRVLVVEDQPVVRDFLAQAIHGAFPGAEVKQTATVAQAHQAIDESEYMLALLDISLPDGNGIELIPAIKKKQPNCMLVMCTIFDDDEHLFAALRAGAKGYLLKEHPREEMIDQLRQIQSGHPPLSPVIANRILDHFHHDPDIEKVAPDHLEDIHLTERETEVLTLIAKGLTRAETAEILGIGVYTVADYIKNVYRKLKVTSRTEAVLEAMRMGLIQP